VLLSPQGPSPILAALISVHVFEQKANERYRFFEPANAFPSSVHP